MDRTLLLHVVDFSNSCPSSSLQGSMWRVKSAGTQILFITFWNTVRSNDMNPKSINSAKEFRLQNLLRNQKRKETNVEWNRIYIKRKTFFNFLQSLKKGLLVLPFQSYARVMKDTFQGKRNGDNHSAHACNHPSWCVL